MKKIDLEDGMVLKLRNNQTYEIRNKEMVALIKGRNYNESITYYDEELLHHYEEWQRSVIEIYSSTKQMDMPVWKREIDVRKLTKKDKEVLDFLLEDSYLERKSDSELYLLPPLTDLDEDPGFFCCEEELEIYIQVNPEYFQSILVDDKIPTRVSDMKKWKVID